MIERALDPAAEADRSLVYSKDVAGVSHLFARDSNGSVFPLTPQLATGGARLLVTTTTVAIAPVYGVFPLSVTLTTMLGAFLDIRFSCSVRHTPNAGNAAINFRFRHNGVLIAPGGGTTINALSQAIQPIWYTTRVPIVAGIQTIIVEWAALARPVGNNLLVDPSIVPNLVHAQLTCEEQLT